MLPHKKTKTDIEKKRAHKTKQSNTTQSCGESKDYFKAGEQVNLNNLYGLTQPPDQRQHFWPVSAGGR